MLNVFTQPGSEAVIAWQRTNRRIIAMSGPPIDMVHARKWLNWLHNSQISWVPAIFVTASYQFVTLEDGSGLGNGPMRRFYVVIFGLLLGLSLSLSAAAKPDLAFSEAHRTYVEGELRKASVDAKRRLTKAERCAVIYRSIQNWKKKYPEGEKKLDLPTLVMMRRAERNCGPFAALVINPKRPNWSEDLHPTYSVRFGDRNGYYQVTIDGRKTIVSYSTDELRNKAERDFVLWHPDEFVGGDSADDAARRAEFKYNSTTRQDLIRQAQFHEQKAREADQKAAQAGKERDEAETIKQIGIRQKNEADARRLYRRIERERREAALKARRAWLDEHGPRGTTDDMRAITTDSVKRTHTDADGNRVVEYDNGAKKITYTDGHEETVGTDGTRTIEFPDGHVEHWHTDGTIECMFDHEQGVLRIVVGPDGKTTYYLNGEFVAGWWPEFRSDTMVRAASYIGVGGITPVERDRDLDRFWRWLFGQQWENDPDAPDLEASDAEYIRYVRDKLKQYKRDNSNAFEDESFDEFLERRRLELRLAAGLEWEGNFKQERQWLRQILDEWEADHSDDDLPLDQLISKRLAEAELNQDKPFTERIAVEWRFEEFILIYQVYMDWIEAHPSATRTAEQEKIRRQIQRRLEQYIEVQKLIYESALGTASGNEGWLARMVGEERFNEMKRLYGSLPGLIPDDAGGSIDPLDKMAATAPGVSFSSLTGKTAINRDYVGDVVQIQVIGVNGEPVLYEPEEVKVEQDSGNVRIDIASQLSVGRVLVIGSTGALNLLAVPTVTDSDNDGLFAIDGSVDIKNGRLRETIRAPRRSTLADEDVAEHSVWLGNEALTTIAVRDYEVAVEGKNIALPKGEQSSCRVKSPTGKTSKGKVDAWGYEMSAQPVAQIYTWAPIYIQVAGLPAIERLSIRFRPNPGQQIEPLNVQITVGQATGKPTQIAQYQTAMIGPQRFDAVVKRLSNVEN